MQERLTSDIQWLAGIVDSEGCISSTYKHGMGVHIANCDAQLIEEVERILKLLSIVPHTHFRKSSNQHWRSNYFTSVHNYDDCLKFLQAVHPYLVGKRELGSLATKLCGQRIAARVGHRGGSFSTESQELATQISALNERGVKNPQRLYAERIIPKIKSELHGDVQSTTEMLVPSLDWFGGILDGDGCASITKQQSGWSPRIVISNTNRDIVQGLVNILASRAQGYYIRGSQTQVFFKPQYSIEILGLQRCSSMLSWITPHVRAKRERFELLFKFVASRLTTGGRGEAFRYTEEELETIKSIRKLNQKGSNN